MDKLVSFMIIILCIYISYKYCSIIEGQANKPAFGDYKGRGTGRGVAQSTTTTTTTTDSCGPGTPCKEFSDKNCQSIVDGDRDNWVFGSKGDDLEIKKKCMRCIQGSKLGSTMPRYLANIGYESNSTKNSYYALRLCDAMAAKCGGQSWYANNEADWSSQDCRTVSITDTSKSMTTRLLCSMLTNSVLQFFMSFMGGVSCSLKIKALELIQYVKHIPEKLEEVGKKIVDKINPLK